MPKPPERLTDADLKRLLPPRSIRRLPFNSARFRQPCVPEGLDRPFNIHCGEPCPLCHNTLNEIGDCPQCGFNRELGRFV